MRLSRFDLVFDALRRHVDGLFVREIAADLDTCVRNVSATIRRMLRAGVLIRQHPHHYRLPPIAYHPRPTP